MGLVGKVIFKTFGWKVDGEVPYHLPKKLYVVIPHTSNWDFPLGIALKMYKNMEVGFIGKKSLFKWPFGWFFRWLGGIPVNRKKTQGFIDSVVEAINQEERFSMSIAPEGTRGKVKKLKSGFYHIATKANIPIVYVKFDWQHKTVVFDKPRHVTGTIEEELAYIESYFDGVLGAIPKNSFGYKD